MAVRLAVKIGKDCKVEKVVRKNSAGVEKTDLVIIDPNTVMPDGTYDSNSIGILNSILNRCAEMVLDLGDEEYNPFAYIINRLDFVYTYYQNPTAATNDIYMFINPTFWAGLYEKGVNWCKTKGLEETTDNVLSCNLYVFLHEIMHDALDHIDEWKTMHASYPDHDKANIAMDYVCNKTIEKMFPQLRGIGNYLKLYYDDRRGDRHWVDEYEAGGFPKPPTPPAQEISDDMKRGYKEAFNEIRELLGGSISDDDVYSKRSAINKIKSIYGPIIKKATGIDINESVEDNIGKVSGDYDKGVITAIQQIIQDLMTDGAMVSGGGSGQSNPFNDRIVDREIISQDQSQSDSNDKSQDQQNGGQGQSGQNQDGQSGNQQGDQQDGQGGGQGNNSDGNQNGQNQQGQGSGQSQNGQNNQQGQGQGGSQGNQQGNQQGQGQGNQGQNGQQSGSQGNQQGQGQGGQQGNQQGGHANGNGNPENGHTSTEQPETGEHMGWDTAKRIQDFLGLPDRNVDRVNGVKGSDRQKTRSNIKRLIDENNYKWSLSHSNSENNGDAEVENAIKKLGVLDWKPILKDFLNKKKTIRNKGKWKDEYRKFDPEVSIRRVNKHKVYTTDHITIILDTSGSVLGTKGTYEFLVSEIGEVLDSIGNSTKLLIDFINFGSSTNIYRFVHEKGHFYDKTIYKFPKYVETGATIYTTSLGMSHIVMNDKREWGRFYDQKLVENMENRLESNTEEGINPDEFGPSACTVLFTDSDFAYGSKYRGGGFGESKINQFHDNTVVFLILDGMTLSDGRDDKKVIDPFAKNGKYLRFSDSADDEFGWNIIFVNRDCLNGKLHEGLSIADDRFSDTDAEDIISDYDTEEKDIEYFGNNMILTHAEDKSKYDNCEVTDNGDKTITIKSTISDRRITPTAYDDIRRITEPLNYIVDGHMIINGAVRVDRLPSGLTENSTIILDKCHDVTVEDYKALQDKYGAEHVTYMNCQKLCSATRQFSDHPIVTTDYIVSYWNDTLKDLLDNSFGLKLYARAKGGQDVPVEGLGESDVISKYWNAAIGIFLEYAPRRRFSMDEVEVDGDSVMENNDKYGFEYDGIPPFIKFIGSNGRIVFTYEQGGIGQLSLKGSMCRYNLITPVASKDLKRETLSSEHYNKGIYLMTSDSLEEVYTFIETKQQ